MQNIATMNTAKIIAVLVSESIFPQYLEKPIMIKVNGKC